VPLGQTQTVTVVARTLSDYGTPNQIELEKSYDVTFKNPCIDTAFVRIEPILLPVIDYTIGQPIPELVMHAPIKLVTEPIVHGLCGGLTTTQTYEGQPIDPTDPIQYTGEVNREFIVDSDDAALID
jgi:hypothetical protein